MGQFAASPDDERDMLPVPRVGEADHHLAKVPRSMVVNIIRPRIEETLENVRDKLAKSGLSHATGNRIVLTGGACQLPGLQHLASRILGHDYQSAGRNRSAACRKSLPAQRLPLLRAC